MTRERVLLNTLHIAKPDRQSEWEVDQGIVIRTTPLASK
jgi:hypothetical protein